MEYYIHSKRLAPRRRFSLARFLAGILILTFFFITLKTILQVFFQAPHILSPLASNIPDLSDKKDKMGASSLPELESQIRELLAKKKGSWSVYFVDYALANQRFGINEQVMHRAASVNKLYVLASLYYLAGRGEIDLDETVTLQRSDIQDFGTGTIRYDPVGTVYSLKTLARLLAEKSDNTAEYILKLRIGESKIQDIVDRLGMRQTSIKENKTSLSDLALLFDKMRDGEITNKAQTAEMIDFLDQSDFEDRLPALLPKDVRVYHKIGNEVGNIHDVGFIIKDDLAYFLGVLSSDVGEEEEETKQTIAQISKLVFDFKLRRR